MKGGGINAALFIGPPYGGLSWAVRRSGGKPFPTQPGATCTYSFRTKGEFAPLKVWVVAWDDKGKVCESSYILGSFRPGAEREKITGEFKTPPRAKSFAFGFWPCVGRPERWGAVFVDDVEVKLRAGGPNLLKNGGAESE